MELIKMKDQKVVPMCRETGLQDVTTVCPASWTWARTEGAFCKSPLESV